MDGGDAIIGLPFALAELLSHKSLDSFSFIANFSICLINVSDGTCNVYIKVCSMGKRKRLRLVEEKKRRDSETVRQGIVAFTVTVTVAFTVN